jgi:hypothetical protein
LKPLIDIAFLVTGSQNIHHLHFKAAAIGRRGHDHVEKFAPTTTTTTKQIPNHNPTPKINPQQTPKKSAHAKKPTTTTKQKHTKKILRFLQIQQFFYYQTTNLFRWLIFI